MLVLAKLIDNELYTEIEKFANVLTNVKKMDSISEGSTQYKILGIVYSMIKEGIDPILINKISDRYSGEYKPSNRTISKHLDNLGFREYRYHFREGSGYNISKDLFESIVITICPYILSSQSSQSSQKNKDIDDKILIQEEIICDDNVTKCDDIKEIKKERCDDVTQNDDNDAKMSPNPTDEELILFVKEKGKVGYDMESFSQKYGEKLMKDLIQKGGLYENPSGILRVLE